MQVARAHVHQAPGIHLRTDHLRHILRRYQSGFRHITQGGQAILLTLERGKLRRRIGQFTKTPAQVTVDGVFANALPTNATDSIPARCR